MMAVSRLTAMMVQVAEIKIVKNETMERWEAWSMRGNYLHALLLSAPLDKKQELEDAIKLLKENGP